MAVKSCRGLLTVLWMFQALKSVYVVHPAHENSSNERREHREALWESTLLYKTKKNPQPNRKHVGEHKYRTMFGHSSENSVLFVSSYSNHFAAWTLKCRKKIEDDEG